MKPISTEQQLELATRLREYEVYIAALEYSADAKTKGIMEGLDHVRQAADFIDWLASGGKSQGETIGTRWTARTDRKGGKP